MNRKIIEVEVTFSLTGGLVVIGKKGENLPDLKTGVSVEILRTNGTKINSQITGIEMPNFRKLPSEKQKQRIGFMLKDVSEEDVPIGSIINLCD